MIPRCFGCRAGLVKGGGHERGHFRQSSPRRTDRMHHRVSNCRARSRGFAPPRRLPPLPAPIAASQATMVGAPQDGDQQRPVAASHIDELAEPDQSYAAPTDGASAASCRPIKRVVGRPGHSARCSQHSAPELPGERPARGCEPWAAAPSCTCRHARWPAPDRSTPRTACGRSSRSRIPSTRRRDGRRRAAAQGSCRSSAASTS
jgi:hypothetical protein